MWALFYHYVTGELECVSPDLERLKARALYLSGKEELVWQQEDENFVADVGEGKYEKFYSIEPIKVL
jgi:hypothetical protein